MAKGTVKQLNRDAARKTSRYKDWRAGVLNRDNFTCVECGKVYDKTNKHLLDAHHIKRLADNIEDESSMYDTNNGVTLCSDPCHKRTMGVEEEYEDKYMEYIKNKNIELFSDRPKRGDNLGEDENGEDIDKDLNAGEKYDNWVEERFIWYKTNQFKNRGLTPVEEMLLKQIINEEYFVKKINNARLKNFASKDYAVQIQNSTSTIIKLTKSLGIEPNDDKDDDEAIKDLATLSKKYEEAKNNTEEIENKSAEEEQIQMRALEKRYEEYIE